MLHNIRKSLHTCKLTRIFAYVKSVKNKVMKILSKELQKNLSEVCELIQLNAKNKNKSKDIRCSVSVHADFFVVDIMEFANDEIIIINNSYFIDQEPSERYQELINGIKTTLGL